MSIGTNMLPSTVSSPDFSCSSSEPMPTSRPSSSSERGAAPFRVRRRREQRLVEQVFPETGEFALGEYRGLQRVRASAMADDEDVVVFGDRRDRPALEDGPSRAAQRLDEAEARRKVVGERVALHDRSVVTGQPDRRRLGDQVADRQGQAVVPDHDAVAETFGSEYRGSERVVRHLGAQRDNGVECGLEIECDLALHGLRSGRKRPAGGIGHGVLVRRGQTAPAVDECYATPARDAAAAILRIADAHASRRAGSVCYPVRPPPRIRNCPDSLVTPRRDFVRLQTFPSPVEVPMLYRFVFVSMLLHALVLITFGTTTSGGARSGASPWGALDVTLRRLSPEPGTGIKLAPGADIGSPGAALLRRLGAATATPAPVIPDRAAERSESLSASPVEATPATVEVPRPDDAPRSPAPAPPLEAIPPIVPAPTPPLEALPPINRQAPEEVDRRFAPSPQPPPKLDRAPAAPVEAPPREAPPPTVLPSPPQASQPVSREIAPPVELPPRELPTPPASQPIERVAPPNIERDVAPAAPAPPREVPTPPAPPPDALEATPRPAREVETQRETPTPPAPSPAVPAAPIPAAPPERTVAPPVDVPAPRTAPAESIAPERIAPKIEREAPAPAASSPRTPPVAPAPRVERVAPPSAAPPALAPDRPSAVPPARIETPSGESPPRLRFGAPDPGDEIFKSRNEIAPPGADSKGTPRLDLEAVRQRTREVASEGAGYRGFVPALPPPPPLDKKSKLAEAIDKAQKPDCRDAYAAMGLLAVPALVASTVANGGCRW